MTVSSATRSLFMLSPMTRKDQPYPCAKRLSSSRQRISRSAGFHSDQRGVTLIETGIAIALIGILLSLSAGALNYYFAGRSIDVAANDIKSDIRKAQSLAVATGSTHGIAFMGTSSYQMMRVLGSEWVAVSGPVDLPSGVYFDAGSPPSFGSDGFMEFYARGTSEGGSVVLEGNYGKSKIIWVDGETVNVHVTG